MPSELERLYAIGRPTISTWEPGTPIIEEMPDATPPGYSLGPPTIDQQPTEAPGRQRAKPDELFERMLSRVSTGKDTGIAQAGEGYLPAAALRPEVQRLFAPYGGASMIDVRDMSPDEMQMLRMWVSPQWAQRQQDPGSGLTEAERAEALRRGRRT